MKQGKSVIGVIIGVVILVSGLVLIKVLQEDSALRSLPYVLVGIGCGVFGSSFGTLVTKRVYKKHPEMERLKNIEEKDERNIAIMNHSKARAYDRMVFVFGALMMCFAVMEVDVLPLLLLVAAYLYICGYQIYAQIKKNKMM